VGQQAEKTECSRWLLDFRPCPVVVRGGEKSWGESQFLPKKERLEKERALFPAPPNRKKGGEESDQVHEKNIDIGEKEGSRDRRNVEERLSRPGQKNPRGNGGTGKRGGRSKLAPKTATS